MSVTSTEEYPSLSPPTRRRGFEHAGISVLPRRSAGLFTHTLFFHALPNGFNAHVASIEGGSLFETLLFNRVSKFRSVRFLSSVVLFQFNVFMTHWQNFGADRLGAYTFESAFRFLRCWTNVNLSWVSPAEHARRYFNANPNERQIYFTVSSARFLSI